MPTLRRAFPWLPYAMVTCIHLVLLAVGSPISPYTHMLPMLALLWPALLVRNPLRWWVVVAVVLSWAGDAAPHFVTGSTRFLLMAGFFLLVQLTWVVGLGNRWSLTLPARRPATAALYGVAAIAIGAATVPFAGALAPMVVLYALALTTAAVLETSLGELGIWGGSLFLVSDALIAMTTFVPGFHFPGIEVLIMFTYLGAQGLLVSATGRIRDPRTPHLGDAELPPFA